jgi:osmotically inducible lipoprotein OsmB
MIRTTSRSLAAIALTASALALAACGHTIEQKAATGAVAGAVVAGPVGAAIGGAAGTAVGQAQKPHR